MNSHEKCELKCAITHNVNLLNPTRQFSMLVAGYNKKLLLIIRSDYNQNFSVKKCINENFNCYVSAKWNKITINHHTRALIKLLWYNIFQYYWKKNKNPENLPILHTLRVFQENSITIMWVWLYIIDRSAITTCYGYHK